jgi:hypothetical protein
MTRILIQVRGMMKNSAAHADLLSGSYRRVSVILSILRLTNLGMLYRFIVETRANYSGIGRK